MKIILFSILSEHQQHRVCFQLFVIRWFSWQQIVVEGGSIFAAFWHNFRLTIKMLAMHEIKTDWVDWKVKDVIFNWKVQVDGIFAQFHMPWCAYISKLYYSTCCIFNALKMLNKYLLGAWWAVCTHSKLFLSDFYPFVSFYRNRWRPVAHIADRNSNAAKENGR